MTNEKRCAIGIIKWSICLFLTIPIAGIAQNENNKPLIIETADGPYVLRCFVDYKNKVKSHAIAVGDPSKLHYAVDADNGSLLMIWKGVFVDAQPMWVDRGGGFFKTPSPVQNIYDTPGFAVLNDNSSAWPDSLNSEYSYRFKGYKLDKAGRPTFKYSLLNLNVEDKLLPLEDKGGLSRELQFTPAKEAAHLYFKLAEGSSIKKTDKNTYTINGKEYSIRVDDIGKTKPEIRDSKGGKALVLALDGTAGVTKIKYSIIW